MRLQLRLAVGLRGIAALPRIALACRGRIAPGTRLTLRHSHSHRPPPKASGDPAPRHGSAERRTSLKTKFRHIVTRNLAAEKWNFVVAIVCTLVIAVADLLRPWPLKLIVDNILLGKTLPPS